MPPARPSPARPGTRRGPRGVSLIESLVVIALVALLASLAGPGFVALLEQWRVHQASDHLQSTLSFARTEALKRGGDVVIAKTGNGNGCTTANGDTAWGCGWSVFYDGNQNRLQDACQTASTPNECTLLAVPAPNRVSITLAKSTGVLTVDRWGLVDNGGEKSMVFELFPQDASMDSPRALKLCLAVGGFARRVKGSEACAG